MSSTKKFLFLAVALLLLVFFVLGCSQESKTETKESKPELSESTKTEETKTEEGIEKITVYYADKDALYLWPFEFDLEEGKDVAEFVIEKLFKAEPPEGYMLTVPENMEKPSVEIQGDTATVDFKKSDLDFYPKGSTGENLFLYSIVNSLVDSLQVKKVVFTVEGRRQAVSGSNYDFTTQEFEFNHDIVGRKQ